MCTPCVYSVCTASAWCVNNPPHIICIVSLQDIEKALMRADVDRDKLKDRHNRPEAVAKGLDLNDAAMVRRRGKMMLPAPQISEAELQQIAAGTAA